jgi:hypothetical protein
MIPYLNLEYLLTRIFAFVQTLLSLGDFSAPWWLILLWISFYLILWLLILVMIWRIVAHHQAEKYDLAAALIQESVVTPRNDRWQRVLKYLESENPAEWKLAIIEADTMLDELVKTLRPHEETLGERLKAIEPSDFITLQDAWDAHKMRNRIAHEGDMALSKHEALRAIAMYKRVFDEFEYI